MLSRSMVRAALAAFALTGLSAQATAVRAAPEIGREAPNFTATDIHGNAVRLSALRGKTVVLEWTNHECPYVRKHYGSGSMQTLQRDAAKDGVIWISIVSAAKGTEGNVTPAEADALTKSRNAAPSEIVLDESGKIGRLYQARTTPHMFVIDKDGKLVYMGGIDDKPTTRVSDLGTAKNYVRAALDALKAGQPVATPISRPYGCSIKYAPQDS
jgi:peroxiredoxin